jgi:CRP-like cAMP-binding protein
MSAFDTLEEYLSKRATFSDEEFAFVETMFLPRRLAAGDFLHRAGDVAKHAAFAASGCLRSYVIDARGKEHIVQFAPETWWVADANSLMGGAPTQYFVDAIDDSELLLLDGPSHQRPLNEVPGYAVSFQAGIQKHAAAKDQRIVTALSSSAEERYQEFLRTYPSIAQRVPQFMLASYLGVSPETLSRIRKSLSRR